MSPYLPKLPTSSSGFFLALHLGILSFWFYSTIDSKCAPISTLLPFSISGIIVGFLMHYWVDDYYSNVSEFEYGDLPPYWVVWIFALLIYFIVIFFSYIFLNP